MSEEELELLVTVDDPGNGPEEDTFNHVQAQNTLEPGLIAVATRPTSRAVNGDYAYRVTFGQGD
jgi:hypothetical protein